MTPKSLIFLAAGTLLVTIAGVIEEHWALVAIGAILLVAQVAYLWQTKRSDPPSE